MQDQATLGESDHSTDIRLHISIFEYDAPAQSALCDVLGKYNLDPVYDAVRYDVNSQTMGSSATLRTQPLSYDEGHELHRQELGHFAGIVDELEEELCSYGFHTLTKDSHQLTENHPTDIVLVMGKSHEEYVNLLSGDAIQ